MMDDVRKMESKVSSVHDSNQDHVYKKMENLLLWVYIVLHVFCFGVDREYMSGFKAESHMENASM